MFFFSGFCWFFSLFRFFWCRQLSLFNNIKREERRCTYTVAPVMVAGISHSFSLLRSRSSISLLVSDYAFHAFFHFCTLRFFFVHSFIFGLFFWFWCYPSFIAVLTLVFFSFFFPCFVFSFSAAVVLCWLVHNHRMSLEDAQRFLLGKRRVRKSLFAQPNIVSFYQAAQNRKEHKKGKADSSSNNSNSKNNNNHQESKRSHSNKHWGQRCFISLYFY